MEIEDKTFLGNCLCEGSVLHLPRISLHIVIELNRIALTEYFSLDCGAVRAGGATEEEVPECHE